MLVYRITGAKHSGDLTGTGAAVYGGRWNRKGTRVLYTGETKEIALLESIVHMPLMIVPELKIITLEIPDSSIMRIRAGGLPENWYEYPAPAILSEIGEKWVKEGKTVALMVPSCVIHSANNVVLNCRHPEYARVNLTDSKEFHFDTRLKRIMQGRN